MGISYLSYGTLISRTSRIETFFIKSTVFIRFSKFDFEMVSAGITIIMERFDIFPIFTPELSETANFEK